MLAWRWSVQEEENSLALFFLSRSLLDPSLNRRKEEEEEEEEYIRIVVFSAGYIPPSRS